MVLSQIDFLSVIVFLIIFLITLLYSKFKLLRIFTLILIFLILSQPTFIHLEKKEKPNIAVLIDGSKSMLFGQRLENAKKFYRSNLPLIEKYFEMDFYQFSENPTLIKRDEISNIKPKGNYTDIFGVLNEIGNTNKYDAIMLFSDGIHNFGSNRQEIKINKPVITICPKEKEPIKDISIIEVKSSDFIFKNVPAEITVSFYSGGLNGKEANIYIRKEKEILASRKKIIDGSYQEVTFEIISSKLGTETYTAEIEPFPEETIISNNKRNFTIETIREKIRILYICGQPSPEYYFLRYFLKSNPSIELVSFVILRNPEDIAVVPDEKLALIPFPAREIFLKDIFNFDLLILENFNYSRFYITPDYLLNVEKFVREKGGGFLMIAGDNAFGKGGYSGTAIEKILPVILDAPDEPFEEGTFTPVVLDRNHYLSFSDKDLYSLEGCQHLRQKPGSTVVAVHPTLKLDGKNVVVLAGMEYGQGRTAALGTNTTWRWLLSSAYEGKTESIYPKFWENI
ncbi:MAG: glutamine amidotransferase, partial [Endomicrobiia bacterium]